MSIKAAASQHHQLLPSLSNCSNVSVPTLLKSSSVFYDKPRGFRFDSLRCQSSASTDVSKNLSTQAGKGFLELNAIERNVVRLGLPSKGRMSTDTLELLKLSKLEVWFLRENDVVRKLLTGDLDLGIVGFDTVSEFGQDNEDLILVHDALEYGECRLSIAIPKYGIFENISSLDELAAMPQWTENRPLRFATGFTYLGQKFVKEKGLKHVNFSKADGALEAAPAMGIADAILDLVGSGTTLRENNLKEIKGGTVLESQGVFVASKRALLERKDVLEAAHEMLERLEAHLRAVGQFTVTANMRGSSADEVAERVLKQTDFRGLEIGGSGVLVSPLTYIFDEEPPRWRKLLDQLNL